MLASVCHSHAKILPALEINRFNHDRAGEGKFSLPRELQLEWKWEPCPAREIHPSGVARLTSECIFPELSDRVNGGPGLGIALRPGLQKTADIAPRETIRACPTPQVGWRTEFRNQTPHPASREISYDIRSGSSGRFYHFASPRVGKEDERRGGRFPRRGAGCNPARKTRLRDFLDRRGRRCGR